MSHIITRLFDNFTDARHAIVELEDAGVSRSDISLVSHRANKSHAGVHVREPHDHTAAQAAGAEGGAGVAVGVVLGAAGGLLAGLGLIAIPGLGPVIAAGWLASAAVGAVTGGVVVGAAGGLIGALTHAGVSQAEAGVYAEGVRRGGTLVSVKVDDAHFTAAETALNNVPYVDIAARGAAYRETGWTGFDETAEPYSEDEALAEQSVYLSR